jgi:hypothetical protein
MVGTQKSIWYYIAPILIIIVLFTMLVIIYHYRIKIVKWLWIRVAGKAHTNARVKEENKGKRRSMRKKTPNGEEVEMSIIGSQETSGEVRKDGQVASKSLPMIKEEVKDVEKNGRRLYPSIELALVK